MAAKPDIKLIDWIQKKYKLTVGQRELLHSEIEAMKDAGDNLSKEAIEELARDILVLYPNK